MIGRLAVNSSPNVTPKMVGLMFRSIRLCPGPCGPSTRTVSSHLPEEGKRTSAWYGS